MSNTHVQHPQIGAHAYLGRARMITIVCLVCLIMVPTQALAAKRKRGPVIPPELKIVSVMIAPPTYIPGQGTLDFTIEIELPKETDRHLLLEVSTLISSPSMRSMRFLSSRQSLDKVEHGVSAAPAADNKPRIEVVLTWDGMDQSKELARSGIYDYEIHAKLLAVGENGVRTHMNAWRKHGTLALK
ncbi:MAG TPA: hypothetical protein VL329_11750 [Nitrospiraceae bacterium]|nr:hypothetical protein [Nitrospiraceae bacterium]